MYRRIGLEEANLRACKLMGYVEMDPSGRYGRFKEVLGKGAMKTVYKAFDEVLGMEVAWYQVKLNQVFQSPEELQRLYSEVHLLKNLKHQSLIKFYTSWINPDQRTFNFITEMFTSGTLREYRQRYKRVDMRAIKNWARRILEGLSYLHSHDPPVIHRDLKCDNIFVNGHLGEVKIGDLGLAAILRGSQHAHSVIGTPEFMAPELYEEDYDELVDVYSFGMCMLEMLTSEYPYSECSNPAQIYKKVTTGKLPQAFYRIQDVEAQQFIAKCLAAASNRPSAVELLDDPFLALNDERNVLRFSMNESSVPNEIEKKDMMPLQKVAVRNTEMTITGTMDPTDDTIFLKVQISDKNGQGRNVYFPFDIKSDTAINVATEMVKELEMNEWRPSEIAVMIDDEISALVPSWKDYHDRHSFNYNEEEDDEENKTCDPFYSLSSHSSSSHASLLGFYTSSDPKFQQKSSMEKSSSHHLLQGEDLLDEDDEEDDDSSQSSLNYWSGCENDYEQYHTCPRKQQQQQQQQQQYTRFGPNLVEARTISNGTFSENYNSFLNSARDYGMMNCERKNLSRIKSLVDIRSQLLHRSLVEEITKRRAFNTVGAVEGIGYKDPSDVNSAVW